VNETLPNRSRVNRRLLILYWSHIRSLEHKGMEWSVPVAQDKRYPLTPDNSGIKGQAIVRRIEQPGLGVSTHLSNIWPVLLGFPQNLRSAMDELSSLSFAGILDSFQFMPLSFGTMPELQNTAMIACSQPV
jgi:hypothetical protein